MAKKKKTLISKKDTLAYLRRRIKSQVPWAVRALEVIFSHQTPEEQLQGNVIHSNDLGFNAYDAPTLTELYHQRDRLSVEQAHNLQRIISKYVEQIYKVCDVNVLHKYMIRDLEGLPKQLAPKKTPVVWYQPDFWEEEAN